MGESVEGQDCGDEAAEWIQHYLNKPRIRYKTHIILHLE